MAAAMRRDAWGGGCVGGGGDGDDCLGGGGDGGGGLGGGGDGGGGLGAGGDVGDGDGEHGGGPTTMFNPRSKSREFWVGPELLGHYKVGELHSGGVLSLKMFQLEIGPHV